MKTIILKSAAVIITLFALITLFMSTSVIFDLFGIREKEGNYVLFVVISNFIAGFMYLFSAVWFIYRKKVGNKIAFNHNNNSYCKFCWFVNSRKYRWNL
jgi:hypothetical protein